MTFSNRYKGFFEKFNHILPIHFHMLLVRMIFIKLKTHHCMPCLKFFCIPLFLEKPALKACKIIPNMVPAPSSSELQFYTLLLSSMELVSVPQWSIPGMDLCLFPLSPKFIFWSPIHPQCDSFRRWGLRKVIRFSWGHEGWTGMMKLCLCVLSCFSCVQLFAMLWTIACQASLSMGFSRPEY